MHKSMGIRFFVHLYNARCGFVHGQETKKTLCIYIYVAPPGVLVIFVYTRFMHCQVVFFPRNFIVGETNRLFYTLLSLPGGIGLAWFVEQDVGTSEEGLSALSLSRVVLLADFTVRWKLKML